MNHENSNTWEFLRVVRQHVIHPLATSGVAESCFAAAMLIFGAIDGLGKLIHEDHEAGAGHRFKSFLSRMGPGYVSCQDDLWRLRNSLMHNSMNVACFMSKTEDARGEHLERYGDWIFIHTVRLLEDFKLAIEQLEKDFRTDRTLFQRAESRLQLDTIPRYGWRGRSVQSTPPPPVLFVHQR